MNSSALLRRPLIFAANMAVAFTRFPAYALEWRRYAQRSDDVHLRVRDADPRLSDRQSTSPFDAHYFHQGVWAAERIFDASPAEHVDVGSQLLFVGMLAAKMPVTFVDLRPLELNVAHLKSISGDILKLPFADRSLASISCLHVVEHIGLGRYGDELNPKGTHEALAELRRVLEPGGNLFLSLPVGRPRVCFNAHRIHDPQDVVSLMDELELAEFSAVSDAGRLVLHASLSDVAASSYACGLFWFRRPA